ncbi:MAG: peptidoglycan/LPS O-acetylase OafA/YrhL [Halioglobus sp.]|jgi:peptidoglycan/LPS O-acetylase OafA/YrhL
MLERFDLKSGLRGSTPYLYELECLRGLAILMVFAFHAYGVSLGADMRQHSIMASFMVSGNSGVTLFFVLSGFLLSLPWLNFLLGNTASPPNNFNFYSARFLRIIPLYYLAVLVSVLATGKVVEGANAAIFSFIGFDIFPYSVVWWTLATEVQFYLLLPVLFMAWSHSNFTRAVLLLVFCVWAYSYITLVILNGLPATSMTYFYTKSLFGRFPAFLIGILAAVLYLTLKRHTGFDRHKNSLRVVSMVMSIGFIFLLGVVLQKSAIMGDAKAEKFWHIRHVYEALLWAAIMLTLILGKPVGGFLLTNRAMAITGKISYSLYLVHVPILFYIIYPAKNSLGVAEYSTSPYLYVYALLSLFASVVLATCTYKLIELPFLNLKHKLPVYLRGS